MYVDVLKTPLSICHWDWGVRVGQKLGQIGPQIGQILDFLRSVSVHFGAERQNALKLILKSPRFDPFRINSYKNRGNLSLE